MALATHFQTLVTAKLLEGIERDQLREPWATSGFPLATTWGPKKEFEIVIKVSCLGQMDIYRAIFPTR